MRRDRFEPPLFDDVAEAHRQSLYATIVFILSVIFIMLLWPTTSRGAELVWAKTPTWSSTLYVYDPIGGLVTNYAVSNCQASASISPGQAAVIPSLGDKMCMNASVHDFGTIAAIPGLIEFTRLTYKSGQLFTTVNVPPLNAVPAGGVRVGPVSNGPQEAKAADGTWLNVVTQGSGYITIRVFDAGGALQAVEIIQVSPPATQYRLVAVVEAGSLEVVPSISTFVCQSCASFTGQLYGFVTIGSPSGSNLSTIPIN